MNSSGGSLLVPFFLFSLSSQSVFGQTGNTVFGLGYSVTDFRVAQGDVTNLFVQGVGGKLTTRVAATSFPLPLILAGISVTLRQGYEPKSVPVPILAVRPIPTCVNVFPTGFCGSYVAITVQIPVELVVDTREKPPNS